MSMLYSGGCSAHCRSVRSTSVLRGRGRSANGGKGKPPLICLSKREWRLDRAWARQMQEPTPNPSREVNGERAEPTPNPSREGNGERAEPTPNPSREGNGGRAEPAPGPSPSTELRAGQGGDQDKSLQHKRLKTHLVPLLGGVGGGLSVKRP